jgi:hypothetical protein
LFVSRQSGNQPISPSTIYGLFRRYAGAADLRVDHRHPHVLRHSIAVHLMNAGWDAADVQDGLGHRDITSTMVYAAVTNRRREQKYERRFSPMRSLLTMRADGLAQKRQLVPETRSARGNDSRAARLSRRTESLNHRHVLMTGVRSARACRELKPSVDLIH